MTTDHVAAALRRPRFLLSAWPWRSLAYLVTTVPIAACLGFAVAIVALPWFATARGLTEGHAPKGGVVAVMVVLTIAAAVLAPLVAVPVGALERRRLRIVDERPLMNGHRPSGGQWLRVRFTEAATWREAAYATLLGTVVLLAYGALALITVIDLMVIAAPWFAGDADGPISIGITDVTTPAQAVPYAIAGLLLLPLLPYLAGLLSAGQAALARSLLGATGEPIREVARSRARLVDAYEAERRRIERDLHDGAQHLLTSLTLHIGTARLDTPDDSPAAAPLTKAHDQAKDLMVMLRGLIHDIRPQTLTDLGLAGAARELAQRSPVPVTVTVTPDAAGRFPDLVESAAYFALAEALTNVAKHARAGHATVMIDRVGRLLIMEVRDDGRGGADPGTGTGLTGLADRVAAVNGRLLLASPPGGPTLVRVELPCDQ